MRLIDAEFITEGIKCVLNDSKELVTSSVVRNAMIALVDRAKTVDAVPVVRCKDCAKRGTINCDLDYCGYRQADDWYCADGESLEDDDLPMCANHYGERRE